MTLVMGLFGVAFILLTFGYIAWEQRNRLIERYQTDIAGNAYFLAESKRCRRYPSDTVQ